MMTWGHTRPSGFHFAVRTPQIFLLLSLTNSSQHFTVKNRGVVGHDLTCISPFSCGGHIFSSWCLSTAAPWHFWFEQEACLPLLCEPSGRRFAAHRADCKALSLRQGLHLLTLTLWIHYFYLIWVLPTSFDVLLQTKQMLIWTNCLSRCSVVWSL